MKPVAILPKGILDNKPPHGSPCNRCGACCMVVPCSLSRHLFHIDVGACPALVMEQHGTYGCGIVKEVADDELREAALLVIGSATGCDARFNGEPINHSFNFDMDRWDRDHADQLSRARRLWGLT